MQKHEFEELIGQTVTDNQYQIIEEVCMWHPSIKNTSGKEEVAELYKSFGMTIFCDMHKRAFRIKMLEEVIQTRKREIAVMQREIEELTSAE